VHGIPTHFYDSVNDRRFFNVNAVLRGGLPGQRRVMDVGGQTVITCASPLRQNESVVGSLTSMISWILNDAGDTTSLGMLEKVQPPSSR